MMRDLTPPPTVTLTPYATPAKVLLPRIGFTNREAPHFDDTIDTAILTWHHLVATDERELQIISTIVEVHTTVATTFR